MYSLVDIANVKNIHVVNKIKYTELFSFAMNITSVLAENIITGRAMALKQDVNTAANLVVMALRCTGKLVGKRGRHEEEPTVHVGYCQVLNILSFFFISQYHCNLSEDIQQSCLTVTINGM